MDGLTLIVSSVIGTLLEIILTHLHFSQHCFFFPGPPNLGLSLQNRHSPQSFLVHPKQVSHRCLLFPIIFATAINYLILLLNYLASYFVIEMLDIET